MSPNVDSEQPQTTAAIATRRESYHRLREVWLPLLLFLGDAACAIAGMVAGYYLRYHTPIAAWGVPVPDASIRTYLPLLALGAAILIATYAYLQLYDPRLLLRRVYGLSLIMKAMAFWFAAYLGISLVLEFTPPISRLFVAVTFGITLVITWLWRNLFYWIVTRPGMIDRIRRRVAVLGLDERTREFLGEIARQRTHPFAAVGYIGRPPDHETAVRPAAAPSTESPTFTPQWLGDWDRLESAIRDHRIDIVVVGSLELPHDGMARLIETCERTYTEWKVIPSAFELFVSNLQLENHGGIPVLGVGPLAIHRLLNRVLKRTMDIGGAALGLVLTAPVMFVAAMLIRRESPGPVLFRQQRIGANHRPFTMYKLRTMRLGAENEDHLHQSTTADDPRVLRIGRFLRRWNIDELPQFWNVLRGDMSLVGPRPERPHHVDALSARIRHYLPRHLARPGMTGWAQINGCRGEGDLERRIRLDIYYLENWSLALDLQILILTFLRWRGPE